MLKRDQEICGPAVHGEYGGIECDEITRNCLDAHEMMMQHVLSRKNKCIITQIPTIPLLAIFGMVGGGQIGAV